MLIILLIVEKHMFVHYQQINLPANNRWVIKINMIHRDHKNLQVIVQVTFLLLIREFTLNNLQKIEITPQKEFLLIHKKILLKHLNQPRKMDKKSLIM